LSNTTGNYNTFSGYQAGCYNTTGYNNTFSGYQAGFSNTTGYYNTFSGNQAGYLNTTGICNTFSGFQAGYSNTTGVYNTFSGTCAGYLNTGGNANTFSGVSAGYSNTTGNYNTFSGYDAGYSNTTGNGNVFIGYQAGYFETGSKKLYIANGPADANVLIYGDFSTGRVGLGTKTPQGKLDVNGSIYQRGSLLHADYVFEGDYKLESIDEHSKFMWQQKHLAAIPKAQVDENGQEIIEVGAHRRGIVEELEKAHIYIEQLHERINTLEKEKQMMEARLTAIESIVAKLGQSQEGGSKSPVE
jgi:type I restriction-modification system DNA methylase subunit